MGPAFMPHTKFLILMADPAVFIEVVLASAVPGFDPGTLWSPAKSFTNVATAAAMLLLP